MGKLSLANAEELVKEGVLTEESIEEMQKLGRVSTKTKNPKRFMKTADGASVSPTLYFRGGAGHGESPKMIKLRKEVNQLIVKYTKPITNGG